MKSSPRINLSSKNNGYQSDDENVRYKLNKNFFAGVPKGFPKAIKKEPRTEHEDDEIRYKFPSLPPKPQVEQKNFSNQKIQRNIKPKNKIKVNFWSNKTSTLTHHSELKKPPKNQKNNRRHTVGTTREYKSKPISRPPVKVRKQVSFLPSPLFLDNHVPMVTVPDDLTIHLNEEEANDIGEDLNNAFVSSSSGIGSKSGSQSKGSSRHSTTQTSPKSNKRKRSFDDSESRNQGNSYELEFFSKYVVQKLRKMETNQRIYSENLINTVLMLGQLGKLNGKSKISEV